MTKESVTVKTADQAKLEAEIEGLELAIDLLRTRMHTATNLAKKIGYYNEIKALQEDISVLRKKSTGR